MVIQWNEIAGPFILHFHGPKVPYIWIPTMQHCLFENPFPFVHNKPVILYCNCGLLQLWDTHQYFIFIPIYVCIYINQYNPSSKTTVLLKYQPNWDRNVELVLRSEVFSPLPKNALPEHCKQWNSSIQWEPAALLLLTNSRAEMLWKYVLVTTANLKKPWKWIFALSNTKKMHILDRSTVHLRACQER